MRTASHAFTRHARGRARSWSPRVGLHSSAQLRGHRWRALGAGASARGAHLGQGRLHGQRSMLASMQVLDTMPELGFWGAHIPNMENGPQPPEPEMWDSALQYYPSQVFGALRTPILGNYCTRFPIRRGTPSGGGGRVLWPARARGVVGARSPSTATGLISQQCSSDRATCAANSERTRCARDASRYGPVRCAAGRIVRGIILYIILNSLCCTFHVSFGESNIPNRVL